MKKSAKPTPAQIELIYTIHIGDCDQFIALCGTVDLNFYYPRAASYGSPKILITPLMIAIDSDKAEMVDYLCKIPVDLELLNEDGQTALIFAANHSISTIKCLVNSGANINAQDSNHNTALHILIQKAINFVDEFDDIEWATTYLDVAELLLTHEANTQIKNLNNLTADEYFGQLKEKLIAKNAEQDLIIRVTGFAIGTIMEELGRVYEILNKPEITALTNLPPDINKIIALTTATAITDPITHDLVERKAHMKWAERVAKEERCLTR